MPTSEIRRAMRAQDRRRFLPPEVAGDHQRDAPLPIGFGQTNSQPSTVATMLALLEPFPGMRALDVGSGSGWTSAILGELGGPGSAVFAVELVPELVERSRAAIPQPWVSVHQARPGVLGLPEHGLFDRILVSAMGDALPQELVDQLADGGVMVAPWGDVMHRVRRNQGDLEVTDHGGYRFVPLRDTRF
ncbi:MULTISPECIES: protein-L-isoaspartate O-methyltransferase family protein [unclassified Dietzia]|uniref:protein-L-isoaspartate O-methyltransferase family protein n=1 Tax=unclassified Dietzia TaxID=2617939 RepID=UPI0015FC679E|nr:MULTISPECIES: protein-L-isoaspartate O-methyltransferase [unclassified Dietzia]MBB1024922.1 protein-L-isoaspartate O-methyltransferase [Dietzia sp. DQ12-76]MBB1029187.1 protein-L-isoaspartate O-methyltransferase [Dietzia sp. DQ11-38-2]